MAIIYPSQEISCRWRGALQRRQRRAPLERFLRAHGITAPLTRPSEVSDDLLRATVLIVETALRQYWGPDGRPLHEVEHTAIGHVACVVSRALAARISEVTSWRVAALLSVAQLLRSQIGLNAAAIASASLVRCYEQELSRPMPALDAEISDGVQNVLNDKPVAASARLSALIALSLEYGYAAEPQSERPRKQELGATSAS